MRVMRIMRIMRIMRVAVGAPMSNNHPNGNSSPEPNHTAAQQTRWVSHDLPRRSPSGRRRAHQNCQTGQTGQTNLMQAPRRRQVARHHPNGNSSPVPNQTAAQQTHGVYRDAPKLSDRSDRSDTSVTPPPPAHRRCHQTDAFSVKMTGGEPYFISFV